MSGHEEEMDFGMGEQLPVPEMTMSELHALCENFAKFKTQAKEYDDLKTIAEEKKHECEIKILNLLNQFKMPSIKNEFGNFIVSNRFTVPTPKTPDEKEAFYQYLKQKGIFDELISVNSRTLNSWYRQEMDAALDRGEVDFAVPGISEPKFVQTLTLRNK